MKGVAGSQWTELQHLLPSHDRSCQSSGVGLWRLMTVAQPVRGRIPRLHVSNSLLDLLDLMSLTFLGALNYTWRT